ncbi:MAG: hypothetical protein E4H02_04550 [Lentisphaerales bacterium]|nr:MAG: hypothetical protein E4H02_04550 [Lentisphaerales bacterium]
MTDIQLTSSFLRKILDANPSVVLIVDADVRIVTSNLAASEFLGNDTAAIRGTRSGEAFSCMNATKSPLGCGHSPECLSCIIRNSVSLAIAGQRTHRIRTRMTRVNDTEQRDYFFLVTAAPLEYEQRALVHLVLEDLTEFMEMRKLIPICSKCKKIRKDDDYWDAVETFMSKYLDLSFTHGYCPECADAFLKEIEDLPAQKPSEEGPHDSAMANKDETLDA